MNVISELGTQFMEALLQLLIHPFYYVSILFVFLQYRKQMVLERSLFSVRLHAPLKECWRAIWTGLAGGLCVSILMMFIGIGMTMEAVWLLWAVSVILALFRVRFLCFAYAAGVLGIAQAILGQLPDWQDAQVVGSVAGAIRDLQVPSLLALAGVLHLLEAALIRWQGADSATPMFYEGKRGRTVGGFEFQSFWPVPLFLMVPMHGDAAALPWTPLFGGGIWTHGWALLALPAMIGFTDSTKTRMPLEKAVRSAQLLAGYGLATLLLAFAADWWSPLTVVAAILAIFLHELLIYRSQWEENEGAPRFIHNRQGLAILDVLPNSAAAEMGLTTGEVIHKVNGKPVRTKEDFYRGLQLNAAFCKLEVLNTEGQVKFVQRAVFSGEHHQLGVLLAPDDGAPYFVTYKKQSLLSFIAARRKRKAQYSALPASEKSVELES